MSTAFAFNKKIEELSAKYNVYIDSAYGFIDNNPMLDIRVTDKKSKKCIKETFNAREVAPEDLLDTIIILVESCIEKLGGK